MRFIEVMNFDAVDDPVKTEETISEQLISRASSIETDYVYVQLPLAFLLNRTGRHQTQSLISQICEKHKDEKLFFICQHIQVNQLDFHGHLVFSPHATVLDSYMAIPHYGCSYDDSYAKPWEEREYLFSFMGSFVTHPVRRKIYEYLSERDDSIVIDTGMWHFEGSPDKQEHNRQRYIELLGNTKYSLCPRGTGPSSIRIWESMAMGACPLIVSDLLKMPLEREVGANPWRRLPENLEASSFSKAASWTKPYSRRDYFEYFTNEKLYKSVVTTL